jgi:hypothetical protein
MSSHKAVAASYVARRIRLRISCFGFVSDFDIRISDCLLQRDECRRPTVIAVDRKTRVGL